MLVIQNIGKMNGISVVGREIDNITVTQYFGKPVYIFNFREIGPKQPVSCWDNAFQVHLIREAVNGVYELYWYGLHQRTYLDLSKDDISDYKQFLYKISMVVLAGKHYFENKKP